MSELITGEIFTDGQQNINAANMNGIVGKATVQPDIIAAKPASPALNVADQVLVLKTDNTLARARFDTIVNSTSSNLPIADSTKNGMLRKVSGKTTDFVDGTNTCQPIANILPAGVVIDFAGPTMPPTGWLYCAGQSVLRATYPELFAAIGTSYGSVDSTHFNVPDYRGKLTPSAGGSFGNLAVAGGAASVALTVGQLPSHAHPLGNHTHAGADHLHATNSHTHGYNNFIQVGAGAGYNMGIGGGLWMNNVNATTDANPSAFTGAADRGLTTGGPAPNSTDQVGSGSAFSILPPYQTTFKIIKT